MAFEIPILLLNGGEAGWQNLAKAEYYDEEGCYRVVRRDEWKLCFYSSCPERHGPPRHSGRKK